MKKNRLKDYGLVFICILGISLVGYNLTYASAKGMGETLGVTHVSIDQNQFGSPDYLCVSGGCGSVSCTFQGGIVILGSGVEAEVSVQCADGYFACCGLHGANCMHTIGC